MTKRILNHNDLREKRRKLAVAFHVACQKASKGQVALKDFDKQHPEISEELIRVNENLGERHRKHREEAGRCFYE